MKKTLSLFLALVMCLTLCACSFGYTDSEKEYDLTKRAVTYTGIKYCKAAYTNVRTVRLEDFNMEENSDGRFNSSGYFIIIDEADNRYKAKYTAEVKVNIEMGDSDCIDFQLDTPGKIN